HDPVHDDEEPEGERERVDGAGSEGEPPLTERVEGNPAERDGEEDLLPGLDRGQRGAVKSGSVERSAHRVVDGKPDEEEVEGPDRPAPDGRRCGGEQNGIKSERQWRGHAYESSGGGAGAPPPRRCLGSPRTGRVERRKRNRGECPKHCLKARRHEVAPPFSI